MLALGLCAGCGGGSSESTASTVAAGPAFVLSTARPPAGKAPEVDWCNAPFDASVIVNAEQVNTNRRYFYLLPGVTWVTASRDNARANLFMRPLPDGNVEVFTGANFPYCLSRPEYVRPISADRSRLRYNNDSNIDFTMDVQTDQGHPKVTLEFKPGTFYGLTIIHCPGCGQ